MYKHHMTRRPWPLTFWRIAAMTLGPIASRSPWYFRYFLHNLKFIMPAYTTWYYIKVSDEVQFYACRCDRKLTKHNFEKQHTGVLCTVLCYTRGRFWRENMKSRRLVFDELQFYQFLEKTEVKVLSEYLFMLSQKTYSVHEVVGLGLSCC